VAEASNEQNARQVKTPFVIRNTAVWLDQHQDWISDGARKLYKTLRTLADARTGCLFIPGRGWIRLSTIEKKAGMSDETRKKYQRELLALSAIRIDQDRVTRTINGRKRQVRGQAQVTILPLQPQRQHKQRASSTAKAQKPNTDATSSTAKNTEKAKSPHKQSASSTAKSKKALQQLNSSAAQEFSAQRLSNSTSSAASVGSAGGGNNLPLDKSSSESTSPRRTLDDDIHGIQMIYGDKAVRWASEIILARASAEGIAVQSPQAYVRAALPKFFHDELTAELEYFVKRHYGEFWAACNRDANLKLTRDAIHRYIMEKALAYDLPIGATFIWRTIPPPN
jgi:hypothetical protein